MPDGQLNEPAPTVSPGAARPATAGAGAHDPAPNRECWLHPDVAVRVSPIAGRGWFAGTPLAAGTPVSRLGGRLVPTAELHAMFEAAETYVDTIHVGEDCELVLPPGTPNHFGNHSCAPNLGWADAYTLVTMRDVAAGEELTQDYATSTADPAFLLRCHCETYRCRQLVSGEDWRIPELQRRYAGYWVPAIAALIAGSAAPDR